MLGDIWTAIATVAAVASAIGAWWVYRSQSRAGDFELARSLHQDLTSGEVARARDTLTRYRRGGEYSSDVVHAYFTLIWCFERIWRGRESIVRRAQNSASHPAVDFLDDCIDWHVLEWHRDFPEIRMKIRAEPSVSDLDDQDSVGPFAALAEAVASSRPRRNSKRFSLTSDHVAGSDALEPGSTGPSALKS